MFFTLNGTCDSVTITSTHLNPTNESVRLTIKGESSTLLDNVSFPVSDASLVVNQAFPDGVYEVILEVVKQNLTVIKERGCLVSLCGKCSLINNLEPEEYPYLLALLLSVQCEVCDCDNLRKLFKYLKDASTPTDKCCPMPLCKECSK